MSRRAPELLLAAGAALALAVLWTWPVAADLSGSLPWDPREGEFRDARAHQGPWALWHAARAVRLAEDPFEAPELGSPFGGSVALEEHALTAALLALPLTAAFGAVAAANAVRLLLLALALGATFALGRAAGLTRSAAALAAAAFALCAHHMEAGLASPGLGASPWLPLAWLCLLRLAGLGSGGARRGARALLLGAAAGLCAAAALLSSPQSGPPALVATAITAALAPGFVAARRGAGRGSRGTAGWLRAAPLILGCVLLLAAGMPFALAAVRADERNARPLSAELGAAAEVAPGPALSGPAVEPAVRVLDLFAPPALHPLLRADGRPGPGRGSGLGPSLFPGLSVLVLASCAALYARRARRWLALAGLLLALTIDPGGVLARSLASVPGLGRGLAAPGAFFPAAELALALTAGFGLDALRRQAGGTALAALAAGILPLELLAAPYPVHRVHVPLQVDEIRDWPGEGAVCVLPLGGRVEPHPPALRMSADGLTWQTVHCRPVAFGWFERSDPRAARLWASYLPDLVRLGLGHGEVEPAGLSLDLAQIGADHVLLRTRLARDAQAAIAALDAMPGWTRAEQEDGGVLWWYRSATVRDARTAEAAVAGPRPERAERRDQKISSANPSFSSSSTVWGP